jgi:hypothetical protein
MEQVLLDRRTLKGIGRLRPSISARFAQQPGTPEPQAPLRSLHATLQHRRLTRTRRDRMPSKRAAKSERNWAFCVLLKGRREHGRR